MPRRKPRNEPVWWADPKLPEYAPLVEDLRVDVGVVGAGIAGLTTAYLLAREGRSVAVVGHGPLGSGMTGATTAHLTAALDRRYTEIARVRGAENARLAAASHTAAIGRIEAIASEEGIDCDFTRLDGFLFLAPDGDPKEIDRELEAARAAGLGVERADRAPLPSFRTGPAVRFPDQAKFHPLRYLGGLARALVGRGGRLFTQTRARTIEGGENAKIGVGGHAITCGSVVVATNVPVNDLVAIHTKQAPYMTYAIGARIPAAEAPRALLWDTEDPFHYVRTQPMPDGDGECLIVGGEDHKTGQAGDTGERHGRLERWARERFPAMREVAFQWAGQVMETLDGLAFIGRNPMDADNVFVVTGDSGNGLTHGTVAGMLLTDLILGRDNPWRELYDPSRKPVLAAGRFARENLNVAAQYADRMVPPATGGVESIPKDGGAVLRRGNRNVAVYRGARGALHEMSAICPHLGCVVAWNPAEKTWDCPCHGSRFDKLGRVVNGPANERLAKIAD
jgi:glycine/D-amino acid oxidase-like deaminating enzyme/nitrite reductase/ring-hydroxylating ferredoxin subunit